MSFLKATSKCYCGVKEVKMSAPLETSRFKSIFVPLLLAAVRVVQTETCGVDGIVYCP